MRLESIATTDINRIIEIESLCCNAYAMWTKYQYQEFFDNDGEILTIAQRVVRSKTEDVIGFVCYAQKHYESHPNEHCVHIVKFGIHQDYQRQGYGTQCYCALARRWFSEGATYLWTNVHQNHDAEFAFWETLGFNREKTEDYQSHTFWQMGKFLLA